MSILKCALAATTGLALIGAAGTARADAIPLAFSFNPAGATPAFNGGPITNAADYVVSDYASVSINTTTGTFTEQGVLQINTFKNGGSTVPSTGLGTNYNLYLAFNAAGTQPGVPTANGTSVNGTFTSLAYQLIGTTAGSPPLSFTVSNGSVAINDPGSKAVLATGALIPGTGFVTLTKTANGFSPSANVNLTFNECLGATAAGCTTNEAGFFTAPTTGLTLQVGNFSATDTVTSTNVVGNTTFLNIGAGAGGPGGGNLTFIAAPIPEPVSLALLGAGLAAVGLVRRRRA